MTGEEGVVGLSSVSVVVADMAGKEVFLSCLSGEWVLCLLLAPSCLDLLEEECEGCCRVNR